MKQKLLIFTLALFTVGCVSTPRVPDGDLEQPVVGCASMPEDMPDGDFRQLVSVVEGDGFPTTVPPTGSIANGGFFISGYGRGPSIGNGGDESTAWFHSFNLNRPQWNAFEDAAKKARETASKEIVIRSAKLELIYTPRKNGNDYIRITGLKGIAISQFDGFPSTPFEERQTVSIELLADDRYTSEDILDMLNPGGRELVKREREHDCKDGREPGASYTPQSGVLLMRYADDAIIHCSRLTLTYESRAALVDSPPCCLPEC